MSKISHLLRFVHVACPNINIINNCYSLQHVLRIL